MRRKMLYPSQAKILNKKAEANGIQSTKGYILTGRHRDEELSSATLIQEPPSIFCCHQNQHSRKSEAYNTRIYNSSVERSQYLDRRSKMVDYKYSTWYPKHVPRHSREDFVPRRVLEASKTCRSYRVLCSISLSLQTEPMVLRAS